MRQLGCQQVHSRCRSLPRQLEIRKLKDLVARSMLAPATSLVSQLQQSMTTDPRALLGRRVTAGAMEIVLDDGDLANPIPIQLIAGFASAAKLFGDLRSILQ